VWGASIILLPGRRKPVRLLIYNRSGAMTEKRDMRSRVEETLDKVRPAMRADGGDARIVACDEESGSVSIQMIGACKGCPLSQLDFAYAIESLIKREVPEVREILAV
jgi:Fe-S cluster biogenesis protein NfuA